MEYRLDNHDNHLQLCLNGEYCYDILANICRLAAHNCSLTDVNSLLVDFSEVEVHGFSSSTLMFAYGFAESYKQLNTDCSTFKLAIVEGELAGQNSKEKGTIKTTSFFGMPVFITSDHDQALDWIEGE